MKSIVRVKKMNDKKNEKTVTLAWDPFSGCNVGPTISNAGPIHALYWPQVIAAIYTLSQAVQTLAAAGNEISRSLIAVQDALHSINTQLNQLSSDISKVITLLQNLPNIIKGQLTEQSLTEIVTHMRSVSLVAIDYTDPKAITDERRQVQLANMLDTLNVTIHDYLQLGGLMGAIAVAPSFAIWVTGATALEKIRAHQAALNGKHYDVFSPWGRISTDTKKECFIELYKNANDQKIAFDQKIIPIFPKHNELLQIGTLQNGDPFLEKKPHNGGIGPTPVNGDVKLACPATFKPEKLLAYQRSINPPNGQWVDANSSIQRAAFEAYKDARIKITTFFDFYPNYIAIQSDLMNAFNEPQGLWE
jgi:uncharacterized protein YeeX (DUF496 family)